MGNFTEVDEFTSPIAEILGSDPRNAATYNARFQAVINRSLWLSNRIPGWGATRFFDSQSGAPLHHFSGTGLTDVSDVGDIPDVRIDHDALVMQWNGMVDVPSGVTAKFSLVIEQTSGGGVGSRVEVPASMQGTILLASSDGIQPASLLAFVPFDSGGLFPGPFSDGAYTVHISGSCPAGGGDAWDMLSSNLHVEIIRGL